VIVLVDSEANGFARTSHRTAAPAPNQSQFLARTPSGPPARRDLPFHDVRPEPSCHREHSRNRDPGCYLPMVKRHWPTTPGLAAAQTPAPPLASLGDAHLACLGQARPAATVWMVRGPGTGCHRPGSRSGGGSARQPPAVRAGSRAWARRTSEQGTAARLNPATEFLPTLGVQQTRPRKRCRPSWRWPYRLRGPPTMERPRAIASWLPPRYRPRSFRCGISPVSASLRGLR
jgi:hypothetical protein